MAFELPKCGGLKFNTGSFQQIGNVVTDINATAISGGVVTACGQQFDEAYFKVIGHTVTMPTVTTAPTTTFKGNCGLQFDGDKFDLDEDGAIEYNPDIVGLLTITTTPTDATILLVDSNDMPVLDPDVPGVFPVLVGETYTYTVSKTGYVTQTAEIEIPDAVEEVEVTLELAKLTMDVTPDDATVTITDSEGTEVEGTANVYPVAIGSTYTYSVSKIGYTTQTSTVAITQDAQTVTVVLVTEP